MLNLQYRLLLIALAAWTRLPAGRARTRGALVTPADRVHGLRYLPLAGLAVVLPAALVYAVAGLWLPHAVALLAALGAMLLLTGAVHERGFAAWCEDLAARARTDGGLTAAGAAGLVVLLLAKFETLSSIDPSWIAVSLVCAAAFSRGCAVFAVGTEFVEPASQAPRPGGTDLAVAMACAAVPVVAAALWTASVEVFGTAAGMALVATALVRRTLGRRGLARDERALGAIQQLAELAFHVGILATLSIVDETLADPAS
jgi:adenosylcobinamide-GDP ribazoletransferase